MKKNVLFLTTLSVLACTQLNAQMASRNPFLGKRKLDPITQGILQRQSQQPVQRGTVITDRLVGWSIYNDNELTDTAHYKYNSAARGSALDNNMLDTYLEYGYDPINEMQRPYPLGVNRNSPISKYDTGYYASLETNVITYSNLVSRGYTSGNLLNTQYDRSYSLNGGTVNQSYVKTTYAHDGTGNLTNTTVYIDSSAALNGSFVAGIERNYLYTNGHINRDSANIYSAGSWIPSDNVLYTYNTAGNLIRTVRQIQGNNGWEDNNQDIYTYTSSNKLNAHLSQYKNSTGGWSNDVADTFTYQGNNLTYNAFYSWSNGSANWSYATLNYNYYNAQGNLDSQLSLYGSSGNIMPDYKATYSYTSYNHFDKLKVYYHDGTAYSTVPDAILNLYYETYNAPTAISNVPLAANGITLYPNPAADVLNVRFTTAPQGTVNVRIYNVTGQLVQSTSINSGNYQVPVQNLTPGNYIAEISDQATAQRTPFVKH